MKTESRTLGTAALIACMLGIAASAPLNKYAMASGLHPIWLNVLRLGVAVLVLLPFFFRQKGALAAIKALPQREFLLSVLSGVMLAIHFACWAFALKYADSVIAVSIWSTFSLMTVAGSSLLLHERTPVPALLGMMLAIVGVIICAVGASGTQLLGVVMALLAAVTQAIYTLCGRAVRRKLDTLPYTAMIYTIALVCLLGCALVMRIPTTGMNARGITASIGLALICTLGGHSMQNYALKYFKAPTVSAAILTEVFTGPMLVFLFFGEAPTLYSVIGGLIILIGVAWYMLYEWRNANGSVQSHGRQAKRSRLQA